VVLRYDRGRVLAADHVESVGLAVIDERLFHRFSGRSGLVVERTAWQDFGTGRRRQFEVAGLGVLLHVVHLLLHLLLLFLHRDHVIDALVTSAAERVLDGRQIPVVHLCRFAVGHESHGHCVQVLVRRLLVRLAQPLVDGRTVVVKVRMWWQLDDEHLRIRTAFAVHSVLAPRLAGQAFPVMVSNAVVTSTATGGSHPLHAQSVQQLSVVLLARRLLGRRFGRHRRFGRGRRRLVDRVHHRKPLAVIFVGYLHPGVTDVVAFIVIGRHVTTVLFLLLRSCRYDAESSHHRRGYRKQQNYFAHFVASLRTSEKIYTHKVSQGTYIQLSYIYVN